MTTSGVSPRVPAFIVLEGLSGSGKSTIAVALASALGYRRIDPVHDDFRGAIASLRDERSAVDARYALYIATLLRAAAEVHESLAAGCGCVVDTWFYRTHLTHLALGATLEIREPSWVPVPDRAFWLEVPTELRRRRMEQRGTTIDAWKRELEGDPDALATRYHRAVRGLVDIDASGPPEVTVAAILAHLEAHPIDGCAPHADPLWNRRGSFA